MERIESRCEDVNPSQSRQRRLALYRTVKTLARNPNGSIEVPIQRCRVSPIVFHPTWPLSADVLYWLSTFHPVLK